MNFLICGGFAPTPTLTLLLIKRVSRKITTAEKSAKNQFIPLQEKKLTSLWSAQTAFLA